jgi:NAD(P)H-nitrite reductase large subunit
MNPVRNHIKNNSISSAAGISNRVNYVIIGNGPAATSAIAAIRETDLNNPITLISDEPYTNYSRPLISYLLANKIAAKQMPYLPDTFYQANKVKLILDNPAKCLDIKNNQVILSDKQKIQYDKLLIATGTKPIIPRIKGAQLNGAFTFTKLQEIEEIARYIRTFKVKEAVIIGGGLIGLKATEGLMGLSIKVTIIELADRILSATFDKKASQIIKNALEKNGGTVITKHTVAEIKGEQKRAKSVVLNNDKKIPADLVIMAVGVTPNIELVRNTAIRCNKGIRVDKFMQTSEDNIYAAGDCCEAPDLLLDINRSMAIWINATQQGKIAGYNMAGVTKEYQGSLMMNSVELCGVPTISVGITVPQDASYKVIEYYQPEKAIYKKVLLKDHRIIGTIFLGDIERAGIYTGLIKDKADVTDFEEHLTKEDFGLVSLPREYRKHLVTGAGLEI